MLLHVRHEDVKVERINAFLKNLCQLFYPLVVFSVVLNEKNKVQIIKAPLLGLRFGITRFLVDSMDRFTCFNI